AAFQSRPPALFSAPDGRSTNVLAAGNPRADATGVYFNFSPSDNSAAAAPSPYTRPLLRSACVPLRRFRLSRGDRGWGTSVPSVTDRYRSFSAISLARAVDKFSCIFASIATYLPQAGERSLRGAGTGLLLAAL
ncbi:MAG: hypothetical protein WCF79_22570, partial [Rhodomicrobium sp.]